MNGNPVADISEQEKETVLAKIHVTMGFSSETLTWFKEIQDKKETFVPLEIENKLEEFEHLKVKYDEVRKGLVCKGVMSNEEKDELLKLLPDNEKYCGAIGSLFEKSQVWFMKEGGNLFFSKFKSILIESTESIIRKHFLDVGLPENKLPRIIVFESYLGSFSLEVIVKIVLENMESITTIAANIATIVTAFVLIKKEFNKKASEEAKKRLPLNPPENLIYTNFKFDFSPLWNLIQKDISGDISELIHLMFVGLMGAYKEVDNILKEFHDQNNKPSHGFLFIESLLHQPLYGDSPCKDIDDKSKKWIFSPFPHRLIRHSLFVNNEDITKQDILIRFDDSIFTQYMYERWKKEKNYSNHSLQFERLNEIFIDGKEIKDPFFAKVQGDIQEELTRKS